MTVSSEQEGLHMERIASDSNISSENLEDLDTIEHTTIGKIFVARLYNCRCSRSSFGMYTRCSGYLIKLELSKGDWQERRGQGIPLQCPRNEYYGIGQLMRQARYYICRSSLSLWRPRKGINL